MMTPEQRALAEDLVKSHIAIGLSIDPIDYGAATRAALSIYEILEKPKPSLILHVASPFATSVACVLLHRVSERQDWHTDTATFIRRLADVETELLSQPQPSSHDAEDTIIRSVSAQIRHQVSTLNQPSVFDWPDFDLARLWDTTSIIRCPSLVKWKERKPTLKEVVLRRLFKGGCGLALDRRFANSRASSPVRDRIANVLVRMDDAIHSAIRARLSASFHGHVHTRQDNALQGIATASWACSNVVNLAKPIRHGLLPVARRLAHESGLVRWNTESVIISDRPCEIHLDTRQRLHRLDGPALLYRDGWAVYAVHGVTVPPDVIENPVGITLGRIDMEKNIEVRRVLIERYGAGRYMLDSGAELLHRDATGLLYRRNIERDEPVTMVRVLNSTPEPDGTLSRDEALVIFGKAAQAALHAPADARFKEYMIRVPPGMIKAHEAIAWTFGLTGEEYHPALET